MNNEPYMEVMMILKKYPDLCAFAGHISDGVIADAERRLSLKFPESYRWFCSLYGAGSFGGQEFYGLTGKDPISVPNVIFVNEKLRGRGLPLEMLFIASSGSDWGYVLDCSRTLDGEAPVIEWTLGISPEMQCREIINDSFLNFFLDQIRLELEDC